GAEMAVHVMVQRPALAQRHADHALLGGFRRLADRLGHLARLAGAVADPALAVANDHQGGKAEAPAALHDLRDAVDADELLDQLALLPRTVAIAVAAVGLGCTCHVSRSSRTTARLRGPRRPGPSPGHETDSRRGRRRPLSLRRQAPARRSA